MSKKLRYYTRLIIAFLSRFKGIIVFGVVFGVILFFLAQTLGKSVLFKEKTRIGYVGRYNVDNIPQYILNLISDGLTSYTEDGSVEPAISENWEVSDSGKIWKFNIKEGMSWQNGDEIQSEDVNYDFEDVEVQRPDDKTIIFKLKDPFSPFTAVVTRPIFKKGLLGSGEWEVKDIKINRGFVQSISLENENGQRKQIKFYPTEESAKIAFKLGEVDQLKNIFNVTNGSESDVTKVKEEINDQSVVTIFFNTEDAVLSDKSLRQALIYSIDKSVFDSPRALSPISPNSWAFNPQVKKYTYDSERAKGLIQDLPDELKYQPIKLVTPPTLLNQAETVANYWRELGLDVVVQVSSAVPSEFQAYMTIFDTPHDPDQYAFWHSTQTGTNLSRYKNPRIDKLLEDGRTALDKNERKKIYLDFQRFLVEDSPAAFLYHPPTYTISRD